MRGLLTGPIRAIPLGRLRLELVVLPTVVASASLVALMGISAWLISFAALLPPVLYLQAPAVGARTFAISHGVFRYVGRLVGHDVALRMQSGLRMRAYDSLAHTTLTGAHRDDPLTQVVADAEIVTDVVVRMLILITSGLLAIIGASVGIVVIPPWTGLALFVTTLLAGTVVPLFAQRATLAADRDATPIHGELADAVREMTRAAPDLVIYGTEHISLARLPEVNGRPKRLKAHSAWVRGVATSVQVLAAESAVVAELAIGGPVIAPGAMHPTFLVVLALVPLALREMLATFVAAAQTWTRTRSSLACAREILDADPIDTGDVVPGKEAGPELELDGMAVGQPGAPVLRDGLDLVVKPREEVACTGTSGIGKTTLVVTAMGLIPPRTGTVRRGGQVGYLAQDAHIFTTSVAENVRVGNKDTTDEQVRNALHRAGLPLDPDRLVGKDGGTLPGGERRRLALARSLVANRNLWILDEPTEHLDRATTEAPISDVWRACEGRAVLVISHDPAVVAAYDRELHLT